MCFLPFGASGEPLIAQLGVNAKGLGRFEYNDAHEQRGDAPEEDTMKTRQVGMDEMQQRVARFKDLKPSRKAFVDSLIPGHEREIFNVIGRGVTEDTTLNPAITDARDFNLTMVHAEPGKGAALHAHPTVEVFMALSGRWSVYWGDAGEHEIVLEQWDTISVPPGVLRGFRNAGPQAGYLMAILGGTEAGHVTWAPEVLERARETGLSLDAAGNLVTGARA
jgi:mannose-6-phosphate isomerase-like protein (cupin superfamily)